MGSGAQGGGEVMEWMKSLILHFKLAFHLHALSSSAFIILFVRVHPGPDFRQNVDVASTRWTN